MLTLEDVLNSNERNNRIKTDKTLEPVDKGTDVQAVIKGKIKFETQYHYSMEPQTCVVVPTEDGMEIYSSTQWLDITNVAVARCLNIPVNRY